jgi:hypothetical protein
MPLPLPLSLPLSLSLPLALALALRLALIYTPPNAHAQSPYPRRKAWPRRA